MTAAEMEEYTSVVKEANQLLISQKKQLQSKDQQIKELELMVAISDKTVPVGYDRGFLTTEQYNTYNTLKTNYQQKYPKQ